MWGALQDAARIITLLLDKSGESHRKCPRCRGSGLLGNAFTRLEKKGAHLNQPCWFCEGIGALPTAGLNGFVLARTTPCLKALDNHNQPCVDVLQLSHRRYCKETLKFTNAKLGVNLADLLFDLNKSPWMKCNSLGCQQNVLEKPEASESVIQPYVSKPRLQPLSSFSQKDSCLRKGFFQRILNSPLVLSIRNNSQPDARLSHAPLVSSLQPSAILVPVKQKTAKIHPVLKLGGALAMQHASYKQKTPYWNVSTIDNLHLEPEFSGHFITKQQIQTASNVVSTKRRRLQRKARNCIRDKAKKEARVRAQGLMSTLKHKGEPDLADFHVQPECTEATSKSLQGLGAHGEHFLPSDMPSRVVWLTTVAVVSRQVLLNRLIADDFKVFMPSNAKSTR